MKEFGFRKLLLVGLFLTFLISLSAQVDKVDRLKQVILSQDEDLASIDKKVDLAQKLLNTNLDSAYRLSEQAYQASKEMLYEKGLMTSSNMLGNYFQRKGDLPKSINYYNESKNIALKLKDNKGLASVNNNLGIVYLNQGEFPKALAAFIEGLNYEKKRADQKGVAESYNNIAVVHFYQSDFDKCAEFLKKSVAISEAIKDSSTMKKGYNNIGAVLEQAKKYDEALYYYSKTYRISQALGEKLDMSIAVQNMANIYVYKKDFKTAQEYYNQSVALKKEIGDFNGLATIYVSIGAMYGKARDFGTAKEYIEQALAISKEKGLANQELSAYKSLRELYQETGDFKKALDFELKHTNLKDSLYNIEKTKSIAELQTKFETADKEKQLALREADLANSKLTIKRRNNILVVISAVFALSLIVGFGWYNRNRYRQRQYRKQMELKQKLADAELRNKIQGERERISRDLHDHIGSQLTLIISGLDILGVKTAANASGNPSEQIDKLSDQARSTMGQLRETIWAMNKEHVSLEMLVKKVQEFIQKANVLIVDREISAEIAGEGSVIISPARSLALFRVCQEAINNAIKYADFNRLNLSFTNTGNDLVVVINDDGKGFDKKEVESRGYGLDNMAFRIEECGGEFDISSTPGQGTRINMKFNLN